MTTGPEKSDQTARSHRKVALACLAGVVTMGAMSYAAVPLYRMFCQVTGFGGTTQRADQAPGQVLDRMVRVRFDANVAPGLGWQFEPLQRTVDIKVGENVLAFYKATNTSGETLTGTASFNVSPDVAGKYFAKMECFCFTEQTLAAGQSIDMPVSFFVDPGLIADRDAALVHEITLSYTFHRTAPGTPAPGGEAMKGS